MKRWICTLLVLALCVTFAVPNASAAYEEYGDEVTYYLEFSNQLTPAAKNIYDALVNAADKMIDGKYEVEIKFSSGITQDIFRYADYIDAVSAFTRDHSEIFWIDFSKLSLSLRTDADGNFIGKLYAPHGSYYIDPYTEISEVQHDRMAMLDGLDRAVESIDVTAPIWQQLMQAHDWVCMNTGYNDDFATTDMRIFEAVSALDRDPNTKSVCEGYARAFKMICDELEIPCILVVGVAVQGNSIAFHMWNYVYVDGAWYAVDATWDDALAWNAAPRYTFFMIGGKCYANGADFEDSHVPSGEINSGGSIFAYPKLSDAGYEPEEDSVELIPIDGFKLKNLYKNGIFSDVAPNDWYTPNVAMAYMLGLMVGNPDGTFNVNGSLSVAETISIAARIHSMYNDLTIPNVDGEWYQSAVDYALAAGIIDTPYENYNVPITRAEFAQILSRTLPADQLAAINAIADGDIPDVESDEDIYMLYCAGVLRGDTDGTFHPDATIRRCEVAAIVTRMVVPALRVEFTL